MISLVLGNGHTRLSVSPEIVAKHNSYACNLAYRDFKPNNLVACDRHIFIQSISELANKDSKVWTRSRWLGNLEKIDNVEQLPKLPFALHHRFDRDMNWGSGTYAAYLACLDDPNVIVFAGFDLWGNQGKVNNIYAGQQGYGPKDASATDPSVWIYQFKKLFDEFQDKQFVFLNFPNWKAPEEWQDSSNFFQDELKSLASI